MGSSEMSELSRSTALLWGEAAFSYRKLCTKKLEIIYNNENNCSLYSSTVCT